MQFRIDQRLKIADAPQAHELQRSEAHSVFLLDSCDHLDVLQGVPSGDLIRPCVLGEVEIGETQFAPKKVG